MGREGMVRPKSTRTKGLRSKAWVSFDGSLSMCTPQTLNPKSTNFEGTESTLVRHPHQKPPRILLSRNLEGKEFNMWNLRNHPKVQVWRPKSMELWIVLDAQIWRPKSIELRIAFNTAKKNANCQNTECGIPRSEFQDVTQRCLIFAGLNVLWS